MKPIALVLPVAVLAGCVLGHAVKEIPPPGGCDACHRQKIAGVWEVMVAPVSLGREGGVAEPRDTALREVRDLPYHERVPTKRLVVYAAALPDSSESPETGVQCFLCHRSPTPPHEKLRGVPHPWGRTTGE